MAADAASTGEASWWEAAVGGPGGGRGAHRRGSSERSCGCTAGAGSGCQASWRLPGAVCTTGHRAGCDGLPYRHGALGAWPHAGGPGRSTLRRQRPAGPATGGVAWGQHLACAGACQARLEASAGAGNEWMGSDSGRRRRYPRGGALLPATSQLRHGLSAACCRSPMLEGWCAALVKDTRVASPPAPPPCACWRTSRRSLSGSGGAGGGSCKRLVSGGAAPRRGPNSRLRGLRAARIARRAAQSVRVGTAGHAGRRRCPPAGRDATPVYVECCWCTVQRAHRASSEPPCAGQAREPLGVVGARTHEQALLWRTHRRGGRRAPRQGGAQAPGRTSGLPVKQCPACDASAGHIGPCDSRWNASRCVPVPSPRASHPMGLFPQRK